MDEDNTETLTTGSSSESGQDQTTQVTDATADSSTADAKTASDSSTEEGAKPDSLADAIAKAANASSEEENPTETSPDSETAIQEGDPDEGGTEKAVSPAEGKPQDADVPFHKHPRWREKVEEAKRLTEEVNVLKPKVVLVDELTELTGGEDGLKNLQYLARTYAHDPANAVPLLEKLLEDARSRGGLVLQSEDLKQKVADGLMDETAALEVEQARKAKATLAQQNSENQQRTIKQKQLEMQKAVSAWESNLSVQDPDFAGMTDEVIERLMFLGNTKPPTNAQEAVALANQAYEDVKKRRAKLVPAKPSISPIRSSKTAANASPTHKSLQDAVRFGLSKR